MMWKRKTSESRRKNDQFVVKFLCQHTFAGKTHPSSKTVYKPRTHVAWMSVAPEGKQGLMRFFSSDDRTGEWHDSDWQQNSQSSFRFVDHPQFGQYMKEPCRSFEAAWNWIGDAAAYQVNVYFVMDEEAMKILDSLVYTGYRYINGKNVKWCKLIETSTEYMYIPPFPIPAALPPMPSTDSGFHVLSPSSSPQDVAWPDHDTASSSSQGPMAPIALPNGSLT